MTWFKSCPRCKTGDVISEKDYYGPYFMCLQCGYRKDIDLPVATRRIDRIEYDPSRIPAGRRSRKEERVALSA